MPRSLGQGTSAQVQVHVLATYMFPESRLCCYWMAPGLHSFHETLSQSLGQRPKTSSSSSPSAEISIDVQGCSNPIISAFLWLKGFLSQLESICLRDYIKPAKRHRKSTGHRVRRQRFKTWWGLLYLWHEALLSRYLSPVDGNHTSTESFIRLGSRYTLNHLAECLPVQGMES